MAKTNAERQETYRERKAVAEALLREILTHTHATARLPAELLERVKAAVGDTRRAEKVFRLIEAREAAWAVRSMNR